MLGDTSKRSAMAFDRPWVASQAGPGAPHRQCGRKQIGGEFVAEILSQPRGQSLIAVSIPPSDGQCHVCEFMRQREAHAPPIIVSVQEDEPTAAVTHDAAADAGVHRLLEHDDVAVIDLGETIDHGNRWHWTGRRELGG